MSKIFLSIGAGPGMSLETASRFAAEGFEVVLASRSLEHSQLMVERLTAQGFKAGARACDAVDPDQVTALVDEVSAMGELDVLHYNAAAMRFDAGTIMAQPVDSFNADLAVNVGGAMVAIRAALPRMVQCGRGSLLLTGGGFGVYPKADHLSLSVGKAGLRALALALFEPCRAQGVHVGTVTVMGFVNAGSVDATGVAQSFWELHNLSREHWTVETQFNPTGA